MWLVTIKLPRNPEHNPHAKRTGACPVSPVCTDVTGEHHTALARTEEELALLREKFSHITRVEEVGNPNGL